MNADRLMRNMMQSMGMGMPFGDPFDDLMGGVGSIAANHRRPSPFGMLNQGGMSLMNPMSMMGIMADPFQSMQQAMSMAQNGSHPGGGLSYCSSSFTSYTTDEHGRPQVYQQSNEVKQGPNGLKETKSAMRDSRTGQQELAIGHHLRDKARIKKKSKNAYTGEEEQAEDLVNLDESEADTFERTWREQARSACSYNQLGLGGPGGHGSSHRNQLALTSEPHSSYNDTDQQSQQQRYPTTPKHSLNLASKLFKKDKKKKKTSGGSAANGRDERHK